MLNRLYAISSCYLTAITALSGRGKLGENAFDSAGKDSVCIAQSGDNINVRGALIIVLKVQRSLLRLQENECSQ